MHVECVFALDVVPTQLLFFLSKNAFFFLLFSKISCCFCCSVAPDASSAWEVLGRLRPDLSQRVARLLEEKGVRVPENFADAGKRLLYFFVL